MKKYVKFAGKKVLKGLLKIKNIGNIEILVIIQVNIEVHHIVFVI